MNDSKLMVIVLGLHRSGINVLSKGLETLGIPVESDAGEAKECFERAPIVDLNDKLLGLIGKRWDSLTVPPWENIAPLLEPYKAQALALLERDFSDAAITCINDQRMPRVLPFWQSVFEQAGIRVSYIIALRNPLSYARSMSASNGFKPEKSYLLWLAHLLAAIEDTAGKPRVVVDYDMLIAYPTAQLERIASLLDLPVTKPIRQAIARYTKAALSGSLRHNPPETFNVRDDPRIPELVARTYDLVALLAQDGANAPQARQAFDEKWQTVRQAARDATPILRYLDVCEDRIDVLTLVAGNSETGQLQVTPSSAPQTAALPKGKSQSIRDDARISVVIPLYNHAQYIEETIESVLAQTLRPAEIIVIDDGSTDASAATMLRLCREQPDIIFWSWPNQGAHHTLNAAIHRATGDFVAILNSDDSYDRERLASCLAAMRADLTIDAVVTGISFVNEQGQGITSAWYDEARTFYKEADDLSLGLFHANFLMTTSNMFLRRAVFESVGYFAPLRYAHDLEFFLRLILANKKIHFLDRPLLAYRFHGQNTITESQAGVDVELAAVFALFLYRHRLTNSEDGQWRAWLGRYVEILGQKNILELVEHFLTLLEGAQPQGAPLAPQPAAEFRQMLAALGADWIGWGIGAPLLTQFVAARNDFLRRWERSSGDAKVIAAFSEQERTIKAMRRDFNQQERNIQELRTHLAAAAKNKEQALDRLNEAVIADERELADIKRSHWHQLGLAMRQKDLSFNRFAKVGYHFAACLTPQRLRPVLEPLAARLKQRYRHRNDPTLRIAPQSVRPHRAAQPHLPLVMHVIANFNLGGSSRLVADLVEALNDRYEHHVVTSYLPQPPVYAGINVTELRSPQSPEDVLPFLRDYDPKLVHVHYWGDVDWWWYDIVFRAAEMLGCSVIQNVNTPVHPYRSECVARYVHVSRYVQNTFGSGGPRDMTIYPGSDFSLFARPAGLPLPTDCIGMVYRLETDKLNSQSIDVFIKVAQRRPQTMVLIVGGGTYLKPYRQAVQAAGVARNFEFTDYVEYAKLPAIYARMTLFVAPVWKESFGQVSTFAMNFGIPVVGYAVGGLTEIVDDEALLAPPGDSDALADLSIRLLDDPARCRAIGANNQARAQATFSVQAMTEAYRVLYDELMQSGR